MKTGICPAQTSNTDAFSDTFKNCRYQNLSNVVDQADTPNSSIRIRPPIKMRENERSPKYLRYSVPNATKSLDLSFTYPQYASEFPKNIYNKEPFAGSIDYWHSPRDPNWLYTYAPSPYDAGPYPTQNPSAFSQNLKFKDRYSHPETQSRFGYDRFLNEYGVGEQSRGYVEPPECHLCGDTPKDVAPLRFYDPYHLFAVTSEFRKMNDSNIPMTRMIK